eukprot:TRINITY_DN16545_c2_g3_i1.p1 TRINITY_DN16545_c2_g3~~TRINITY_DN16545_c2_g3_i1.p1  ORF type:complete len:556 (+),score=69.19 TRINITY_DN16545_c2_g3_i1:124-1668(+)
MAYLLLLASLFAHASADAARPHIVFILQDDFGHYDSALYGNTVEEEATYNITKLARRGVLLDRHYVHWHCSPTRRSFLTGRLPLHHGEFLSKVDSDDIDLRYTWISEKLQTAGYISHWYGKGHTGYRSMNHMPVKRGFNGGSVLFLAGAGSYTKLPRWNGSQPMFGNQVYSTDLFGSLAVQAVESHDPAVPLFIYLPFQAVHAPYDLPPTCSSSQCPSSIRCMIQDADRWIGKLVAALKTKGMYENTLIVYSSDNGGVKDGINYPLRGEKHTNYDGGMRVAAFVSGGFVPESVRGTRYGGILHIVDWYPTFASLAGVDGSDDPPVPPLPVVVSQPDRDIYQGGKSFPPVDGRYVWDNIIGKSQEVVHNSLWLSDEVLVHGQYKLVVAQPNPELMEGTTENLGWKYPNGSWERAEEEHWPCNAFYKRTSFRPCLFNLVEDPREKRDLAPTLQHVVLLMWTELNRTRLTAFTSRSPDSLLGPCHPGCASKQWQGLPGPVCGVPGCDKPDDEILVTV